MSPFRIKDMPKMQKIVEVFAFLDEVEWNEAANHDLINYCSDDLTADEKLLTHWLCYITDRQTPFQRVWDVGGYVISHLVREYERSEKKPVLDVFLANTTVAKGKRRLTASVTQRNERLRDYDYDQGDTVVFASRYAPADLVQILRTLLLLDLFAGRRLSNYVASAIKNAPDMRSAIRRVASGLDELTYSVAGGASDANLDTRMAQEAQNAQSFSPKFDEKRDLFNRKRLWCAWRDYLKSPEFNACLVDGLADAGIENPEQWRRENPELRTALDALELPGDLWNNRPVFREGLFHPYIENVRKTWDMPKTVREIHSEMAGKGIFCFRPEQMDVTFDFVPRMCERQMCALCPFGGGIVELCHHDGEHLCPVTLIACGYRLECNPDACKLRPDAARGLCQRAVLSIPVI